VDRIIGKYSDLFRLPDEPLGHTDVTVHRITTVDYRPVSTKQYRFPPIHKDEINKQIKDLLENDIIKASDSPYNSPVWVVPKKSDSKGNKRMVKDFRALNEKTIGDAYPLPNIKRNGNIYRNCRIYIYLVIYICIMIYIYIPYVNEFTTFG